MSEQAAATSEQKTVKALKALHRELDLCSRCPKMERSVVHGPAISARIMLIGQAPGSREGVLQRPFAWTAGKKLFSWFARAVGASEDDVRAKIYIAAVARCFPGKSPTGRGDREPDASEIAACGDYLAQEVKILRPQLIIPVGKLAISQVLGIQVKQLADVVGNQFHLSYYGLATDIIPLPHPSGASTWFHVEPGRTLLGQALQLIAEHPAAKTSFGLN